jgi:hypothetical protein
MQERRRRVLYCLSILFIPFILSSLSASAPSSQTQTFDRMSRTDERILLSCNDAHDLR